MEGGALQHVEQRERTRMTKLQQLAEWGQSVCYDNNQRSLLDHGGMQELIDRGVSGLALTLFAVPFASLLEGSEKKREEL